MNFADFLNKAWSEHGDHPEQTATQLAQGLALCTSASDVVSLVNLTTHLYSEHLQKFVEGERQLREIGKNDFAKGTPAEFAVARAIMAFRLCDGSVDSEQDRLGLTPADLARSLGIATSALSVRDSGRAEKYLRQALQIATSIELTDSDGVARGLAIAGNNTAASLEEVASRTDQQTCLMLLAAETGRKFWEIAGTWLEVERAEYRWAKSCLQAGLFDEARTHAKLCLSIAQANGEPPLEIFFAYEALADIEKTAKTAVFQSTLKMAQEWFEKLAPDDQSWARKSLEQLAQ